MDHNFPEALDAILADKAYARRACYAKENDKYVFAQGHQLLFNDLKPYVPSSTDIFADDWQIFGKGVLGTGNNKKEVVDQRHKGRAEK